MKDDEVLQVEHLARFHCQYCEKVVEVRAATGAAFVPSINDCPFWVIEMAPPTEANVCYRILACDACALYKMAGAKFRKIMTRDRGERR